MVNDGDALSHLLEKEILPNFITTRHKETRMDVYLELNKILRLEDTVSSVQLLQLHLDTILIEIYDDIEQTTMKDVVHIALRTLSYFMYHRSLARSFTSIHITRFLSTIMHLLSETDDPATYKLCLWCLTMQNLELTQHTFLPRMVEAFVQAMINPFQARAIEIQALEGLHTLLLKHSHVMVTRSSVLRVWFRPVVSRLTSSHNATRDQAMTVLSAASTSSISWPQDKEIVEEITSSIMEYALAAMETNMTQQRHAVALRIWIMVLQRLKATLATDLRTLNEILYVPEMSMQHIEASVRLLSIEAWEWAVVVFRQSSGWVFKKSVLVLLIRPILICIQEEKSVNVLCAALNTWKVILGAVVEDFNAFCDQHDQLIESIQQSAKKWKRWVDEVLKKVVVSAMERYEECRNRDPGKMAVLEKFGTALVQVLRISVIETNQDMQVVSSPTGKLITTQPNGESVVLPELGTSLLGLALVLPDILSIIQKLARMAIDYKSEPEYRDLATHVWHGFTQRLHNLSRTLNNSDEAIATKKLRLRLVRLCLDFSFGISSCSTASTNIDSQASVMLQQSMDCESVVRVTLTSLFEFRWQVMFIYSILVPFHTEFKTDCDELLSLFHHPKTKIAEQLRQRMEKQGDIEWYQDVYHHWSGRVDLCEKRHVVFCILLYLILESTRLLPVIYPDTQVTEIVAVLLNCIPHLPELETNKALDVQVFVGFVKSSCGMMEESVPSEERGQRLLDLCLIPAPTRQEEESQATTSSLLQLQASKEIETPHGTSTSMTVSTKETLLIRTAAIPACLTAGHGDALPVSNSVISISSDGTNSAKSPNLLELGNSEYGLDAQRLVSMEGTALSLIQPQTPTKSKQSPTGDASGTPSTSQSIYPPLTHSTEPISQLYRHFPMAFRQFFTFYRIKTVGDLSSMSIERISAFGIRDPVVTVLKALEEFNNRKSRMQTLSNSPFRNRLQSPTTKYVAPISPATTSPSPKRILKRPSPSSTPSSRSHTSPLLFPKRAKRELKEISMVEMTELKDNVDDPQKRPRVADRVQFCLEVGDGGTRITRPGEDSQDTSQTCQKQRNTEEEEIEEKFRTLSAKFLQHLRRSVYYIDKLVAEDESLSHSMTSDSLRYDETKMKNMLEDMYQAHELVTRVSAQLQVMTEHSGKRCERVLSKS